MTTQEIYNYRKVNELLSTAGQPTEAQLRAVAADGFTAVINLAPTHPEMSFDETAVIQSLGLLYHHIPVPWNNPQESEFITFERAMKRLAGEKTLVHCAANFRVTAFYSLYAMKHLGWTEAEADTFRASIWQGSDYPVWEAFIQEMKEKISSR